MSTKVTTKRPEAKKAVQQIPIGKPKKPVNFEAVPKDKPKQKNMNVSVHDIAKMLVKVIPLDFKQSEFKQMVDTIERKIQKMDGDTKTVLKAAYVFSCKVPKQERQDLFQDLTLKLIEANPKAESWAYTIARCDWLDWYRKYKVKSQYSEYDIEAIVASEMGINSIHLNQLELKNDDMRELVDTEREKQYNKRSFQIAVETLTGLVEYERLDNQITAKGIIKQLPENIIRIASKRMIGKALLDSERKALCRYIKANSDIVSQYRNL